jgi:hypothetical protein
MRAIRGVVFVLTLALPASGAAATAVTMVDDFESIEGWTATASEGAQVWIAQEPGHVGQALRVDFDLGNSNGYVIVRKAVSPRCRRTRVHLDLLGEGLRNNFEFKLVDPSARNVWWWRQRDFVWPPAWQTMTVRRSRLDLARGTSSNVTLQNVAVIELAITGGEGGSGSIWIDQLAFEERPIPAVDGGVPTVDASSWRPGFEPGRMLDGGSSGWHSESILEDQTVTVDFGESREYGGVIVDWDPGDYATAYDVETSTDGERWTTVHSTQRGNGRRDYLYMPESESRFRGLRRRARAPGIASALRVQPAPGDAELVLHTSRARSRALFPKDGRADVLDGRRRRRRR